MIHPVIDEVRALELLTNSFTICDEGGLNGKTAQSNRQCMGFTMFNSFNEVRLF